ncbi:MAG: LapA family protein [Deltaproteobacteria bacterium]|nr:LapA family protein [Deltaproteobacteria bacterium]
MRYFKVALILVFLLVVLVFIFQNSAVLATAVELKYGFGEYVLLKAPPLYIIIFCALFLGAFMVAVLDLAIIFKNRRTVKKQQKTISELENELSRFRNQPLTENEVAISPALKPETIAAGK